MTIGIVNDLLARLGDSLGTGALRLDADNAAGLTVDGQVRLGLRYDELQETLLLYADLGDWPGGEPGDSFLRQMLRASLFGRVGGGCGFSLADGEGPEMPPRVVLWRVLAVARLEPSELELALGQIADAAADWQDALAGNQGAEEAPESHVAEPDFALLHGRV